MERVGTKRAVLGVSGGLDSTLTLLAAAYAFSRAGYPMEGLVGITMPGMGTGSGTLQNALKLMELIGCKTLTIPIAPAVVQHFSDIGQNPDVHDIAYENSQARERTQIIMDYANKIGGLALGTGDLSELALGWCTYNGDQMSMYNMSASVPKTLIRHLVRYAGGKLGGEIMPIVEDILDTPISPELIPSKEGELTQRTGDTLGAYALHDFFLYHMMDSGASPLKLFPLAKTAFDGQYDDAAILSALRTFVRRFFTQQFKRSAMPDGPKVGSVSLSPRGDWRMPSDAQMTLWLDEVEQLERNV
ncbi:MAG: NAD(+) synthase [Christensenellales bacterium]